MILKLTYFMDKDSFFNSNLCKNHLLNEAFLISKMLSKYFGGAFGGYLITSIK